MVKIERAPYRVNYYILSCFYNALLLHLNFNFCTFSIFICYLCGKLFLLKCSITP